MGSEDEDTICRLIVEKLAGKRGISFEEIARAAYDEGRGRLATELLNHEPRAGKQVPLLLNMEEDEIALDKAIESGDSDLIFFVLLHLKKKLPLASFFRVINTRPTATALIESSAQADDGELLKDLYYQDDRRVDGANVFVQEALKQPGSRTATDKLALAAKLLSDSKDTAFELKAMQEATSLLKMQEAFDRDLTESFTGLSVNETMFKLIKLGYQSRAKKLQSEFKVPEKIAWWIRFVASPLFPLPHFLLLSNPPFRLRALVSKRDWAELETLSNTRKSPIGWEPFFNLVLSAGNPKLAALFIPKAAANLQSSVVIEMWEKCGMRVKAAEEAVRAKDVAAVDRLRAAAGVGTVEGREIERLGAGLKR
jgi:hypothetical protein